MHNSKKAWLFILCIVILIVVFSLALSLVIVHGERDQRKENAGTIDFAVIGASQAQCAFVPDVIDEILDCKSYNLSITSMTVKDKYLLLEKEIKRNPIKTVIVEVSHSSMSRPVKNNAADGNYHMYTLMETFPEKVNYLLNFVPFDNWAYVFARNTLSSVPSVINHSSGTIEDNTERGYLPLDSNDYSLSTEESKEIHNSIMYSIQDYNPQTIEGYDRIIQLCKDNGIRVIAAVVPVSDGCLWEESNLDSFHEWFEEYCIQKDIEFIDFNLSKDRYSLFSDECSFSTSSDHMSKSGAYSFSALFAETIKSVDDGKNIRQLFYEDYDSMLKDSPYCEQ